MLCAAAIPFLPLPQPEAWPFLFVSWAVHCLYFATLLMAYRLQERAAGVGFDWPDADGPREKVSEELRELEKEVERGDTTEEIEAEIGDLLFAVVNLARKLGADPRAALERANAKFAERFRAIEGLAAERGIDMGRASLEQLDELWDEVKERE